MMLFDPALALQPVLDVVRHARSEVRVQAEFLPDPLRAALRAASQRGVRLRYLLGPKAAYTLDASGAPLVPQRPYLQGPNAADVEFATATGALFINPRFAELGPRGSFRRGVRSHAFYVTDGNAAALCSGVPGADQRPLRLTANEAIAGALRALFDSEDSHSPSERQRLEAQAQQVLVIGPDNNAPLLELVATPSAIVLTSELDQGQAFLQLTRGAPKTLVIPATLQRLPAVAAARAAGVQVVTRAAPFEGTVVWTPGRAFVGSQRLTDAALGRDREVGVVLRGEGADALRRFIESP
jgi:hypothetical protein